LPQEECNYVPPETS